MRGLQTPSTAHRAVAHGTQPGFSLLELLIASVILGLGLIMVATMFPVALNQHRLSAQQIMATQAALGAKRLVKSHLVPHIDPLRRYRSPNTWPINALGPDLRDINGDGTTNQFEATSRGPIRWDPPLGGSFAGASRWHLMHFETILTGERVGVEPASRYYEPTLSYADEQNGAQSEIGRQRPAWFHIADTVSPPVRFPTGGSLAGEWAESSYVWYVFYQRPSPDPTSTALAYYVAVCRVGGGAEFLFQDLQRPQSSGAGGTMRRDAGRVDPQPASTKLRSRLPIPWLIPAAPPTPGDRNTLTEADNNGRPKPWTNGVTLSQLAPRGARLIGQTTGTVYTVIASPSPNDPNGHSVEVLPPLPQVPSEELKIWLFPPPVVVVDNEAVWQPQSPFITGLQF